MPSQPPAQRRTRFETAAILAIALAAQAPTAARPQTLDLPRLRTRSEQTRPVLAAGPGYAPPITTLGAPGAPLPAPSPLPLPLTPPTAPHAALTPRSLDAADLEATALHAAMVREVRNVTMPSRRTAADTAARATAMLRLTNQPITEPQLVIVVDRNPAVERLTLMMARPGGPEGWRAIGSAHVSTGQSGRKDYYITPIGAFAHTAAILDFRALGTYNEHHVRGLGVAGMRVWDFGWQWAIKGWHTDGEGGDIRLQMHATDPDLLERRLGHPASEGCVRLSSTMNRFLDRHGVLDADYERAAIEDVRYSALLPAGATPSPFAGRLLVVIDSNLPAEFPPTAASRPAGLPRARTAERHRARHRRGSRCSRKIKASPSFKKKRQKTFELSPPLIRTKPSLGGAPIQSQIKKSPAQTNKSFLVLFFKKEHASSLQDPSMLETPQSLSAAATLILAVLLAISMLMGRAPFWLQVALRIVFLALLTVIIYRLLGSPFDPVFAIGHPGLAAWQRLIEAGWWFAAARAIVGAGRLFVVLENRPRETQIVSDLVAGAVYVATVLAVVNFSIDVPIRGLLATSGVIAIVLGLALQSTLSDVFSGIAVGLERPYKPGDLLWVEGGIEGRVVQLNWRSTQIATAQDNIATIPNSIMAKARMINRSAPTLMRADTVSITLDPAAPPEVCQSALEAAVRACEIPLATPAPTVRCSALRGDGAVYDINFSIASSDQLGSARAEIFGRAHRHLRHAGVALAVTGLATVPKRAVPTPQQVLEESDLFGFMEPESRNLLADHFSEHWLEAGEHLISEGSNPQSLFVVASGTAAVTKAGMPQLLHLVSPGETLGAIGLITNAPYTVTVTALTRLRVYQLGRADIAAAIAIRPEIAAALEALAERGQAALRRFATDTEKTDMEKPDFFMSKIKSFLRLLGN